MKALQQEAEEHPIIQNWKEFDVHTSESADMVKCFIAGANSEHVKRQKIELAIEQLKDAYDFMPIHYIEARIKELEKQLK